MTKVSEKVYIYKGTIIEKNKDGVYSTTVKVNNELVKISSKSQDSICKYLCDNKEGKRI